MPRALVPAPQGHPGADYVPELMRLAAEASPVRIGPVIPVDTTHPIMAGHLRTGVVKAFASASP